MQVFERCSPHNMPLRSHPEFMEHSSKIQKAFQRLEKSFAEVKVCQEENVEEEKKEEFDQNIENDPDEVDLDVDENDINQEGEREVIVIHRMSCQCKG